MNSVAVLAVLTALLAVLKLSGVIAWGWIAVLVPLWVPAVVTLAILLVLVEVLVFGRSPDRESSGTGIKTLFEAAPPSNWK